MEFWLSVDNHAEKIQLPVNPSQFSLSVGNKNETVNVVDLGDVNLLGGEALASISLSSFFPAEYAPYCAYRSIPEPYEAVKLLEQWRTSKKPLRLIITDTNINLLCAIESFEYGERGGSRDVYYTLSLKEYRYITIEQVVSQPTAVLGVSDVRPNTKPTPKTYTVKSGDSLSLIAKKVYDDSSKWQQIYSANKDTIGSNPNLIYPGQKLVIP